MYDLMFTPKNEEELVDLLEEGEGQYEVLTAERTESKNGNPMIKLLLKVWDAKGDASNIYDYLLLNDAKYSLRKIRHFCYSCGLEDAYTAGKLNAADCLNKAGKLKIGFQKGTNGYSDKNVVADYIENAGNVVAHIQKTSSHNDNLPPVEAYSDIPF